MERYKTRQEFANEIGLSYVTLWRKIKLFNIKVPKGLLSPAKQAQIKGLLNDEEPPDSTRPVLTKGSDRF